MVDASTDRFDGLLAEVAHPFVAIDKDGVVDAVGPRIADLLGWEPCDVVGRSFLDVVAPADRESAAAAFAESVALAGWHRWQPLSVSVRLLRPDGEETACLVTLVVPPEDDLFILQLRNGEAEALIDQAMLEMGSASDVDSVLRTLAAAASDAHNEAVIAYGWDGEHFSGVVGADHLPPAAATRPSVGHPDWGALVAERRPIHLEELVPTEPELAAWAQQLGFADLVVVPVVATPPYAPAALLVWRRIIGIAMLGSSVWDRIAAVASVAIESHRRRALLERAATIDQLTELENRRGLVSRLDRIRSGETDAHRVTALYCDLDGFKAVNDACGHLVGDRVLAVAAQRLRNAVRPSDVVARVGGDEFAVILVDAHEVTITALADRLIAAVSRPVEIDGRVHRVGLSVGIATAAARSDPDVLLDRADRALLMAKKAGKGGWVQG